MSVVRTVEREWERERNDSEMNSDYVNAGIHCLNILRSELPMLERAAILQLFKNSISICSIAKS